MSFNRMLKAHDEKFTGHKTVKVSKGRVALRPQGHEVKDAHINWARDMKALPIQFFSLPCSCFH